VRGLVQPARSYDDHNCCPKCWSSHIRKERLARLEEQHVDEKIEQARTERDGCGCDCGECEEALCPNQTEPCDGECRGCENDGCRWHKPGVLRN
jgi:hypothetical protein